MKENLEKRTFSRRNFLKALGLGLGAVALSPITSTAKSLENVISKNQEGVYPKTIEYEFITPDKTPKYGYSEYDINKMKELGWPPGIYETLNRKHNRNIRACWEKYNSPDKSWLLSRIKNESSNVQMREPAYWVMIEMIDNIYGDSSGYYIQEDLKKNKRFDRISPSVCNFAEGMSFFSGYWIPYYNERRPLGIDNLEEGKKAELCFLKSMFTALKYDDRIPNYNKLSYFEKRVREKEIGEKLAVKYQNSSMEEKERIIKNLIIPKINELDNYGDDYMRKLWFTWAMTLNSSNYANMTRYSEDDERTIYGDKNFDLFFFNTEKILTPKKGKYILPQVRGPPYYYDKIF